MTGVGITRTVLDEATESQYTGFFFSTFSVVDSSVEISTTAAH